MIRIFLRSYTTIMVEIYEPMNWVFLRKEEIAYHANPYRGSQRKWKDICKGKYRKYSATPNIFVNWRKIAKTISLISIEMRNIPVSELKETCTLSVTSNSSYTNQELSIIKSWFGSYALSVRCVKGESEGSFEINNGRHRTWSCWKVCPNNDLPFYLD